MKRMVTFKSLFNGGVCGLVALAIASCAQGFDNDEQFQSDVKNAQLESPKLEKSCFSSRVNADGSESIQVSWTAVTGAGGYQCIAKIVDDPTNPVEIYNGTVDSPTFLFEKQEDTKYEISVQTLGNEKLNNKEATQATVFAYDTFVPSQAIPAGSDIVAFVQNNLIETDDEQGFTLAAGAEYTIDAPLDFGTHKIAFYGDKLNHPIVTFGIDGVIRTSAGLKVKFINFDCTSITSKGMIECSSNPSSDLIGPKNNAYVLADPIILQDCMCKNIPMCLFYTGVCAWGVNDFRINDCIVQLDNDGTTFGDAALICTYSSTSSFEGGASWNSLVRDITIKNSTIYNIKNNSKNRVIRFLSNNPSKVYETSYGSATIENCTFYKTFTDKEFANNTPNRKEYTITYNNNILSEVYRLAKFIQGNNTKNVNPATNTVWHTTQMSDSNTAASSYATAEDPMFVGPIDQPLDLTKPNGGVNFKATGAISSKIGDPRWLN